MVLGVPLAVFRVADSKQKTTCLRPMREKVEKELEREELEREELEREAKADNRSLSNYIVKILPRDLDSKRRKTPVVS
jgi:hypothetical protein